MALHPLTGGETLLMTCGRWDGSSALSVGFCAASDFWVDGFPGAVVGGWFLSKLRSRSVLKAISARVSGSLAVPSRGG